MSNSTNPYASPPIVAEQVARPPYAPFEGGVWRYGKQLVMLKEARLPPRCIKSNEPTEKTLIRKLVWYPPWIAFTILIAWPIFLILALVLQKRATVSIGLTDEWLARRRWRIAMTWGLVLLGIATFAGGIATLDHFEYAGGTLMLAALALLVGALIYGNTAARLISVAKIDDRFVYLKGVCPAFLAELPDFPGTR